MSSILTNNSAMVALQTLKSINMNLGKVQSEISTGKTVESAKDNAAVWAISKVMSSDVKGFEAISDSLALGQATLGVATNGAETITDLLTEVKEKIVNSQESNVDRAKIQTDIEALTNQINSIVGAAQFNGLNMLNGSGTDDVEILSSLDRASDGSVTASNIDVARQDLTTTAKTLGGTYVAGTAGALGTVDTTGASVTIATVTAGFAYSIGLTGTDADGSTFAPASYTTAATVAGAAPTAYIAKEGDTVADVVKGLKANWDIFAADNGLDKDVLNFEAVGNNLVASSKRINGTTDTIAVRIDTINATGGTNTAGGGLERLSEIDVTTEAGANGALARIEGLIQTSIDSAAVLGSSAKQIDIQAQFVGKLSDLLTSGIGTLVDADMEAASAKLQALQTQQQLGVQALSIANQAPQTILSLFR